MSSLQGGAGRDDDAVPSLWGFCPLVSLLQIICLLVTLTRVPLQVRPGFATLLSGKPGYPLERLHLVLITHLLVDSH